MDRVGLRAALLVACAIAITCRSRSAAALLFDCRLPNESIQAYLRAPVPTGAVKRVTQSAEFLQFESGKRYSFVVTRKREFVASLRAQDPAWQAHAALARGEPVLTAGGITVIHDGRTVQKVAVDTQSAVYCPTPDSVREAVALVVSAGVPDDRVRVNSRPDSCIETVSPAAAALDPAGTRDYGDVMVEIDRRFQLAGQAIVQKDSDTADYYLFALYRSIAEDLQRSRLPEGRRQAGLDTYVKTFIATDFPNARQAVWDEDWPRARSALEAVATTCNGCHAAAGVGFLVVRSPFASPSRSVPTKH
jgi:hypothetical protein